MLNPWSEERQQLAADLYNSGKTFAEICALMQTGLVKLRHYLKVKKVKIRPASRRSWPQHKIDQCAQLYLAGNSQEGVAKILGTSQGPVFRALQQAGVQARHFWPEEKIDALVAFYEAGATVAECYYKFETTKETVKQHLRKRGVKIRPYVPHSGDKSGNWKGGRSDGGEYIYIKTPPNHPRQQGYILEHRLVMEKHIGRYLLPDEVVHHRDKNKHNNLIENLELFSSNGEHLAAELKGHCPKWSEEGRKRILIACGKGKDKHPLSKIGGQQLR